MCPDHTRPQKKTPAFARGRLGLEAVLLASFTPDAVAGVATDEGEMSSDLHGSAAYRAHLVGVMAQRAVAQALA